MFELRRWPRAREVPKGKAAYEMRKVKPSKGSTFKASDVLWGARPGKPETMIVRVSNEIEHYDPCKDFPVLHRKFIGTYIEKDDPSWALRFINDHGFISLATDFESVEYVLNERDRLKSFYNKVVEANLALEITHTQNRRRPKRSVRTISRELLELFNEMASPNLRATLLLNDEDGLFNPRIEATPPSLISWMWITAAQEINRHVIQQQCTECNSIFWITSTDKRQITCSGRCRVRRLRRLTKEKNKL